MPEPSGTPRRAARARAERNPFTFSLIAVVVGVVAGLGAFALRRLIALFHDLFFYGRFSLAYDTNVHTAPSPWGWAWVLAPAVGALVVVFLIEKFAPEARGHGVPEVVDAIYYQKGVIRPVVGVVKSIASALSIGIGGSVGREGPIIQIGASFASWFGGVTRVSRWQISTLVAAGGGAGIAATFNTPIGGVLFAVEVLMHEVSVRTLAPVALATATATFVGRQLLGDTPAFEVPALEHAGPATTAALLPAYVVLGVLMAFASVVFIRALYGGEDLFEKWIPKHPYLRHVVGMLLVGVVAQSLLVLRGHYYVEGVGYATILDVLRGTLDGAWMLLALYALKLLVTTLTLGSGASGGIFSPSLFMGATLGAVFGLGVKWLFPGVALDTTAFALAGMAGLIAGGTGAALTAIVMIFEMTRDYSVVLPMTLTVSVSYGLRRLILSQNIYTMKLARRGREVPSTLRANVHLVHHVCDLPLDPAATFAANVAPEEVERSGVSRIVLVDGDRVVGVLSSEWARAHANEVRAAASLADVARHDFVTVAPNALVFDAAMKMRRAHANMAVVLDDHREARGILTTKRLAEAVMEDLEE